jgi:hypothetical protein
MKTKVVFLFHWPNDLFAYFPEETHGYNGYRYDLKTSYSRVGQHGSCAPEYAHESRLATKEEYQELYNELTDSVGYDLDVIQDKSIIN